MVVLDEADEMLDMGFREDIEFILSETSSERQTVMFSATMSKEILSLTDRFQKEPVFIDVTSRKINAPIIDQMYFEIPEKAKPEAVARLIDFYDIKLALIFCNTKTKVDEVVEILKTRGYFAEGLHGDMSQRQREKVMSGFKNGAIEILIATDVAGRGIDVNDINAVFNYDLPRDDEDYIHRIGRTGRAGKSGKSFTFVTGREIYNLRRIERVNGIKVTRGTIPSIDDLDNTASKAVSKKVTKIMQDGQLARYINIVENIMSDEYTSMDVAAALLKLSMAGKNEGYDESQIFEIKSKPARVKEKSAAGKKTRSNEYDKNNFKNRKKDNNNKVSYEKEEGKKKFKSDKPEKHENSNEKRIKDLKYKKDAPGARAKSDAKQKRRSERSEVWNSNAYSNDNKKPIPKKDTTGARAKDKTKNKEESWWTIFEKKDQNGDKAGARTNRKPEKKK
jgi:ATP-dependent RNA helicase DeaD